jgi:hypothetical protein
LARQEFENLEKHIFSRTNNVLLSKCSNTVEDTSLEFLNYLPSVKKLRISDVTTLTHSENIETLNQIEEFSIDQSEIDLFNILKQIKPNLKKLSIGKIISKKLDIGFISRFDKLEYLNIEGHTKGIEEIGKLKKLQELTLRSISVPSIDFLKDLSKLWSIDIKLGGIKDFSVLYQLPQIKYLELWQIKGLSDISFISKMTELQNLYLESLTNVTALPSFEKLQKLRRIKLMNLKGLKQIETLKFAPNLQDFFFTMIHQQQPEDLTPVLENPKLKNVYVYFPSDKKNKAFEELAKTYGKTFLDLPNFIYS